MLAGICVTMVSHTGLLSNQGAKSINCYFIMDPFFKKKVLKYGTPKPSIGERMGGRDREREAVSKMETDMTEGTGPNLKSQLLHPKPGTPKP